MGATLLAFTAGHAVAVISPVTTLDGPSADIISFGNVAISEDGSGGVVYLKRLNGRAHVFAAQFTGNRWGRSMQVDAGQRFDSSWPVIAAGDGGRLVVVWAQPFAQNVDQLFFSALDPGATSFQTPHVVDANVGLGKYLYPSISMNRGGQALMTYRVVYNDVASSTLPAGYVQGDIRLAKYDGAWWSVSGAPLERNVNQPQRTPTAANSPRVGIGLDGNGVVAWQEPDDNFYDRIWARRIFSSTVSNVLEVSPTKLGSAPLNANADGLALHVTNFDAAVVAARQQPPANGRGFTRARVYVNEIPDQFAPNAGDFEGARPADGAGSDGPPGPIGPLTVGSSADNSFDIGFGSGSASYDVTGAEDHVDRPTRLDSGASSVPGNPLVGRGDAGNAALAWAINESGFAGVDVLERDADGTLSPPDTLSSALGGGVRAVDLAGSDLGDAVVGFLQGDGVGQTIDVATINAPPGAFNVSTPPTWVNSRRIALQWDPAPHGMTPVTYTVNVDDQDVADGLHSTSFTLGQGLIPNGIHTISVTATDPNLQATDSPTAQLMIDRKPPAVTLSGGGTRVRVRVSDGRGHEVSGLAIGSTTVQWGDGRRSFGTGSFSHVYRRHGTYRVRVTASDNAGNTAHFSRKVRL